jgi:diguanylate cyclase
MMVDATMVAQARAQAQSITSALRQAVPQQANGAMAPLPDSSDVAFVDWESLLNAVKDRLHHVAGVASLARLAPPQPEASDRLLGVVLECVAALDQLHLTLKHELRRREALQCEAAAARLLLAQMHNELLGSRADEKQARHLALHDQLTALPNRLHFLQRLDGALALRQPEGQALAVLYLDLDGLKPINDLHGHEAGDELLRIVASRLNLALRAEDVVSRIGGDEFACLLSNMPSRNQLAHLARSLFDAVAAPLKIGAVDIQVRASIGIAMYPQDGAVSEVLLKKADAAMYRAKRHQTGYAFFAQAAGD